MNKNAPVRGTKDYLPKEMAIREKVKSIILKTYKSFGYMQIGTPVLEDIDNLLGSDGGDNLKLIYKVLKRGEKLDLTKPNLTERDIVDIGLKYDQTVPLVRMFANNQSELPNPFKSIQIDYSFRADRPQLGRARQFTQCDIDILGDATSNAEIDIINTTAKTYSALGFKEILAKINDRRILADLIKFVGFQESEEKEICICLDKLDKIGIDGVCSEMQEKGFDTNKTKLLMEIVSQIKSADQNYKTVLLNHGVRAEVVQSVNYIINSVNQLATNGFKAVFDISIVRGQNYYTGMVYEFYLPGLSGACGGGGRYDKMVEKMTGQSVPAVGYGLGFEPTCLLVMENNLISVNEKSVAVLYKEEQSIVDVLTFIQSVNKDCNYSAIKQKKNLSHQLEILKQNGYTHYCFFPGKDNIDKIQINELN